MSKLNRLKAVVVRFFLCLHFVLVVWRVTVSWSEQYWLLSAAILPFLVEGVYTVVKRAGMEWKMFSLCFFFYLAATLPGIWLLEIKKTMTYQGSNYTQVEDIVVSGVEIPVRLTPNTWVLVTEEMMLYLMILGRWLLPRGGVGREQLTQLLFGFIGIASDIMELFSLFDEDSGVRHNSLMTYCILGVWSLSILQFTLTFTTAHRPRRARGLRLSTTDHHQNRRNVLRVELLATVLSMFMQDGPFLVLRLYTMITFDVITYSLVFFTAKNVLVLFLLVYKVFLLLSKLCCPKEHNDEDEDDEDIKDVKRMDVNRHPEHRSLDMKKVPPVHFTNGRILVPNPVAISNRMVPSQMVLPGRAGVSTIPQLADLRRRRHENEYIQNPVYGIQVIGDLQRAIEGPATPAKKMDRTKKYSNQTLPGETTNDSTKKGSEKEPDLNISTISNNDLAEINDIGMTETMNEINEKSNPDKNKEPRQPKVTFDEPIYIDDEIEDEEPAQLDQDMIHIAGLDDPDSLATATSGKIPTNGAMNALVLSTVEWEEEGEGKEATGTVPTHSAQDSHSNPVTDEHFKSDIVLRM